MSTSYELDELDKAGVVIPVGPRERRALARVSDRLGVEWQSGDTCRIYSRGYVGSVTLSPDASVRVTTKLPVRNVLGLASLAYRTLRLPPTVGNTSFLPQDSVVDWLALLLTMEVSALLDRGMRRDYVVVNDELPYVRGRLRFDAVARTRAGLASCEYADFLPDTPENRALRATLEALAVTRLLPRLRARAVELLRRFEGVALVQPTASLFVACRVTRLNQHYRASLELCRLFLEHAGLDQQAGPTSAPAHFFPMELVFQDAVAAFLAEWLPDVRRQPGHSYRSVAGDPPRLLSYTPDLAIGTPPSVVIDTKYAAPEVRNRYGGLSFHNEHLYQIAFYALSLGCPGLLVYPRVDRDIDVTFDIRGVPVSLLTVDLNQPDVAGLDGLAQLIHARFIPSPLSATG